MEINIDGVVDGPENPDAFFHEFIQWIESKGYIFGGGIGQYKDEMDLFVPAPAILKESTSSTEQVQTISVPARCIPEGSKLVEAYETISKVVVMYGAGEEVPEDHNCDEMGCGSLSHVKYKLRKP